MERFKLLALTSALLATSQVSYAVEIGYDMVDSSSLNLISHTNPFANAFSSPGDGAQKYQRGLSPSIPYAVLDDSITTFTGDTLGIIDDNNLDEFFGVTDSKNGDNSSGDVSASWTFDILGATELSLSIDIGAMGDFEASDTFTLKASIDGAPAHTLLTSETNESGSLDYTLGSGKTVTLNDPMTLNGTPLSNQLQTFQANINGTGSTLTIILEANTDGGSEAFAFQNLRILSGEQSDGPNTDPDSPALVAIHEIQGHGSSSPMMGTAVTVEAIVVGDFQNNNATDSGNLAGFYLQEADADTDNEPQTSEGIFVYDGNGAVDVQPGDRVRVTGLVEEYAGLTEIIAEEVSIISTGNPLPTAAQLSLPLADASSLEAYEGMRAQFSQTLLISEYYNYDRYGEIVLALPLQGESRPFTPTAMEQPNSDAFSARQAQNLLSRITLDDGSTRQNPDYNRHPNGSPFSLSNRFRGGDEITDVTGIVDYRYGIYRIQPTQGATYTATNNRPLLPPAVNSDLRVASFNVLNYFTTLDQNGNLCGPSLLECRGADNTEEFIRQRDKTLAALATLDADIVGLIEIENNSSTVERLVSDLNDYLGAETYAAVSTGAIGTDAIKVGFIYKPATITTEGTFAILDGSIDNRFVDNKNRPVLAQTFKQQDNGALMTVAINHLKSKGSDCDELGDPDLNDGQGNCNQTRDAAAQALVDWLASDPTGSADTDTLILGDLNSYAEEDPIQTLAAAGYTNLLSYWQGAETYSYVFDGQFGYLDYALANNSLNEQVTGTAIWHINADEPDILDYDTSYKSATQRALYEANAYRSSDHDPVIVGLSLNGPASCQQAYAARASGQGHKSNWVAVNIAGVSDPENDPVTISINDVELMDRQTSNGLADYRVTTDGQLLIRNEGKHRSRFLVNYTANAKGGSCSGKVIADAASLKHQAS